MAGEDLPELMDLGILSLDEIYQELHRLDSFEQSINGLAGELDTQNDRIDENVTANDTKTIEDLDTRRVALRTKAMEMSRATIRPLTLLDLPIDIICHILAYFRDPRIEQKGRINWKYRQHGTEQKTNRDTIRNVRCVCRTLNDLASQLLCPVLHVNLDQTSLSNAIQISKCPRVAVGVRGLEVGLQYCPKELATDLRRFKDYRTQQVQKLRSSCYHYTEGTLDPDLPLWMYWEAIRKGGDICNAWDISVNDDRQSAQEVEEDLEANYQEVLFRGHEDYCRKHEEQLHLITSGSFVNDLASCMSRMPHADALSFSDRVESPGDSKYPTTVLRDSSLLPEFMSAGLEWKAIEDLKDARLVPASLLLELPIACHKAGSKLQDIHIGPFPCARAHSVISPAYPDTVDPELWSELESACQHLQRFSFGSQLLLKRMRRSHLSPEDKMHVDQFLHACLRSSELEDIEMNFYAFGLNDGTRMQGGYYNVNPIFHGLQWPRIRSLVMHNVSLDGIELAGVCSGMGLSLKRLYLSSIELLRGSWAETFDILHEKVGSTSHNGGVRVDFNDLIGGEFGEPKETMTSDMDLMDWEFDSDLDEQSMIRLAEKYVLGCNRIENPIKKVH